MKKILSLTLVLAMVGVMMFSALPVAYAAGNEYSYTESEEGAPKPQTEIWYTASENDEIGDTNGDGVKDNQTYWVVTVPALMAPGDTEQVTVAGTWENIYELSVHCQDSVELRKGGLESSAVQLDVTFPEFIVRGDDLSPVSASQDISVEDFNALFGDWTGRIDYIIDFRLNTL